MAKPILFLDVDGVLNPFGAAGVFDLPKVTTGHGISRLPHGTRGRVQRLLDAFEPVWATAWRGDAHPHHQEALGLPEKAWPHINYDTFKLPRMLEYAERRPWAWVDDDADWEFARLNRGLHVLENTITLTPDPAIGLTDANVELLLAWAAGRG